MSEKEKKRSLEKSTHTTPCVLSEEREKLGVEGVRGVSVTLNEDIFFLSKSEWTLGRRLESLAYLYPFKTESPFGN